MGRLLKNATIAENTASNEWLITHPALENVRPTNFCYAMLQKAMIPFGVDGGTRSSAADRIITYNTLLIRPKRKKEMASLSISFRSRFLTIPGLRPSFRSNSSSESASTLMVKLLPEVKVVLDIGV